MVSQPTTKKRKGAPIEAIPESTEPNPMAPVPAKTKKRRRDKVCYLVCIPDWSDIVVGKAPVPPPTLVNIPVPTREPVHVVPPGTEPVLQNDGYRFGLSLPTVPAQAQQVVVSRGQPVPRSDSRNSQPPSSSDVAASAAQGSFAQPASGRVSAQAIRNQPVQQLNFGNDNPPASRTPVFEAVSQP